MPLNRYIIAFCFGLCLFSGFGQAVQAQRTEFIELRPKQNSPLSRFGLGDPLDQWYAASAGMGGISTVWQNPYMLNIINPASLASLQTASFEIGLYGRVGTLMDDSGEASTSSGNIQYMALGFSLRNSINVNLDRADNRWNAGMAFSLAATNLVGYDLELQDVDPINGSSTNLLKGNGGTYRVTWSNGFRYRALSAGINLNYNFGRITNDRVVFFDSLSTSLATEVLEEYNVNGWNIGYGLQYAFDLKDIDETGERVPNGKRIILGLNGQLQSEIRTKSDLLTRRFSPSAIFVSDTIQTQEDTPGNVVLPSSFTFGIGYQDANRLFLSAEYGISNWSNYRNDAQNDRLVDGSRLAFGLQYIPDFDSYNSYFKRLRYRLGFRLEDDPRILEGEQARRQGVTFGIGFPIVLPRQQVSFLNIAVEVGRFGVPDVIDENYVQFTAGFSLNDNTWFLKRKFN
ncbi:MAG: hypothetical protein AAF741_07150 [Bacteroidota bacterium]